MNLWSLDLWLIIAVALAVMFLSEAVARALRKLPTTKPQGSNITRLHKPQTGFWVSTFSQIAKGAAILVILATALKVLVIYGWL